MKLGNIDKTRDGQTLLRNRMNQLAHTVNFLMRQKRQEMTPRVRGGGTPIRNAFCKVAAGADSTIVCYLDIDGDGAAAWADTPTSYDKDDVVTYDGSTWKSTIDDNEGNTPGVDAGWVDIEVTVTCTLIGSSNLNACFPTLAISTMMPVWKDGDVWRSLWWFQAHEECT
jgi:hypothetical protein